MTRFRLFRSRPRDFDRHARGPAEPERITREPPSGRGTLRLATSARARALLIALAATLVPVTAVGMLLGLVIVGGLVSSFSRDSVLHDGGIALMVASVLLVLCAFPLELWSIRGAFRPTGRLDLLDEHLMLRHAALSTPLRVWRHDVAGIGDLDAGSARDAVMAGVPFIGHPADRPNGLLLFRRGLVVPHLRPRPPRVLVALRLTPPLHLGGGFRAPGSGERVGRIALRFADVSRSQVVLGAWVIPGREPKPADQLEDFPVPARLMDAAVRGATAGALACFAMGLALLATAESVSTLPGMKSISVPAAAPPLPFPVDGRPPPLIVVHRPRKGARYRRGATIVARYTCRARAGGSTVIGCVGDEFSGSSIDTSARGRKVFHVTAFDAAGNQARAAVDYTVR